MPGGHIPYGTQEDNPGRTRACLPALARDDLRKDDMKHLIVHLIVLLLLVASAARAGAQCATLTASSFFNIALSSPQATDFEVTFTVTPSNNAADVIVGVSNGIPTSFANFAAAVRFSGTDNGSATGTVQAIKGGTGGSPDSYTSAAPVLYAANVPYLVTLDVRFSTHTYDAYVTALGVKTTVATGYPFRSSQAGISVLNTVGGYTSLGAGTTVCNVAITPPATTNSITINGTAPYAITLTFQGLPAGCVPSVAGSVVTFTGCGAITSLSESGQTFDSVCTASSRNAGLLESNDTADFTCTMVETLTTTDSLPNCAGQLNMPKSTVPFSNCSVHQPKIVFEPLVTTDSVGATKAGP